MSAFSEFIPDVVRVAQGSWFLWLPIFALLLFFEAWHTYVRNCFKLDLEWVFLEVKIPREIRRGPKAMEQLLSSFHSFIGGPDKVVDYYWKGEVILWYSFEIASFGGDIHFYIRTPKKHRNYVEANIYAQYPDIELEEVEDYTLRMPSTYDGLKQINYELWGSELKLAKDDAYPIRLYEEFETPSEYSTLDPIASLIEVLNTIKPGEELWLQIIASPAGNSWQEKGAKFVKKMQQDTRLLVESGDTSRLMVDRTPGQELALKAIERNIAKPGFKTVIRYVHLSPNELYDKNLAWYGVLGAFNQYSSRAHNFFRHDPIVRTAALWFYYPFFFPTWRQLYRRRKIYRYFKNRKIEESGFITQLVTNDTLSTSLFVLNTEELATIYHFPSNFVLTAPSIQRVESRKVGPPASLPAYGTSDELPEGFKKK
ncbi:MAG: hypothetical protein G01um101429_931 [Parcubacteria group bacterium Gr01-1014_29]|nr:MAG: hypothetical protein G01um101429_931 [Parcubacteria group bacterium Gr01-1014_29]